MGAITGDRGLCGSYNSKMLKLGEKRYNELSNQGLDVDMVTIGRKATQYFSKRVNVRRSFECGQAPDSDTATAIAEELFLNIYLVKLIVLNSYTPNLSI